MSISNLIENVKAEVDEDEKSFHVSIYVARSGNFSDVPVSVYHFDKHGDVTVEDLLKSAAPQLFVTP